MSYFIPPWNDSKEPSQGNIRQWLDNLYAKFSPLEQSRWNQGNIDTLFYAGAQEYVNRYFSGPQSGNSNQFYFNLCQQPINMVTGYQRQHRKNFTYVPSEGADPNTTDQYTRIITHVANVEGFHETFSRACELAAISGMVLLQPYLDYSGEDPTQGALKLKLWEYNSFLCDPYARNSAFEDSNFIWCQEYISKAEAKERFKTQVDRVTLMAGAPQRYGNFYFLPESYNTVRSELLIVSYIWYRWKRKKKRLYSPSRAQFFDFSGGQEQLDEILYNIPDLEQVEVEVPTWKLAVVLNDTLMFQGDNPLEFDECPFIPVFWNYEPHQTYYDLRVRSLIRTMRSSQYLLNRQIIISHEQKETTINSGWIRTIDAVANEDNLKKGLNGYDIVLNPGKQIDVDIQKIIPNSVPESDFALADRLRDLMYATAGVNMENWSAQEDKQVSSLTVLMKQAANLMVFQKYFDQWDYSLKLLGDRLLKIVLNNWNPAKCSLILGEEPSPHFFSKIFAKYQVVVEEALLTATQRNLQAQQMMDVNQMFGREVFPPSLIVPHLNLSGKGEAIEFLQQQEQQAQAVQQEATGIQHAFEEAKLQELMSKAASNLATARERHGRAEADIGLFEERISEIAQNNSLSLKHKTEALAKLVETIQKYGEIEASLAMGGLKSLDTQQDNEEQIAKADAKRTALSNEFVAKMLSGALSGQTQQQGSPQQEQPMAGQGMQ